MAEENQVEAEINDILSGVPSLSVEDEAAVEAELEALQESIQEPTLDLPSVPSTKLPEQKEPEQEPEKEPAAEKSGRVAVAS